jgi:hypothetical protein
MPKHLLWTLLVPGTMSAHWFVALPPLYHRTQCPPLLATIYCDLCALMSGTWVMTRKDTTYTEWFDCFVNYGLEPPCTIAGCSYESLPNISCSTRVDVPPQANDSGHIYCPFGLATINRVEAFLGCDSNNLYLTCHLYGSHDCCPNQPPFSPLDFGFNASFRAAVEDWTQIACNTLGDLVWEDITNYSIGSNCATAGGIQTGPWGVRAVDVGGTPCDDPPSGSIDIICFVEGQTPEELRSKIHNEVSFA